MCHSDWLKKRVEKSLFFFGGIDHCSCGIKFSEMKEALSSYIQEFKLRDDESDLDNEDDNNDEEQKKPNKNCEDNV